MFILTLGQETESNQPTTDAPADVVKTEDVLPVDDDVPSSILDESTRDSSAEFDLSDHMATIEKRIKREFEDAPIMIDIAYCESRYRQYSDHETVLTGIVNNSDKGVFQINTYYHGNDADRLGYDLETVEGNIGYGRHLYETQGVQPWVHSSPCWNTENKYVVYR
jgi:hypothetical protein